MNQDQLYEFVMSPQFLSRQSAYSVNITDFDLRTGLDFLKNKKEIFDFSYTIILDERSGHWKIELDRRFSNIDYIQQAR